MIVDRYYPDLEVMPFRFIRGQPLEHGETSNALYGIISTRKDIVLRVSLTKEMAKTLTPDDERYIQEIYLVKM